MNKKACKRAWQAIFLSGRSRAGHCTIRQAKIRQKTLSLDFITQNMETKFYVVFFFVDGTFFSLMDLCPKLTAQRAVRELNVMQSPPKNTKIMFYEFRRLFNMNIFAGSV